MDRKRNEIARSLSMVTQLGISMLAPLILCVCVGIWLDDTLDGRQQPCSSCSALWRVRGTHGCWRSR